MKKDKSLEVNLDKMNDALRFTIENLSRLIQQFEISFPKQKSTENPQMENPKIEFKIGMVGPTGSGKTSLISAIYSEVQDRLTSEKMEFWADGTRTKDAMGRANAVFETAINNSSNIFQVPQLQPNSGTVEYKFAVTLSDKTLPNNQGVSIGFSILDYPGGWLGDVRFAQEITPHLLESAALFVPISADILMYWKDTKELLDSFNTRCNATANLKLDCSNIDKAVRNWIAEKKRVGAPAQLFFVPIKCEKYFNDNGGRYDAHLKLHEAVLERYINPLELTAQDKQLIQVNVFYVDTYGVVELRDVSPVAVNDQLKLVSTFQRRMDMGKKRRTMNAYELLMSILKFQVENRFNLQKVEAENLGREFSEKQAIAASRRLIHEEAKNKAQKRKDSYTWWDSFWYTWIWRDEELGAIRNEINVAQNNLRNAEAMAERFKNSYLFSEQQCKLLSEAVEKLTELLKELKNRQFTI